MTDAGAVLAIDIGGTKLAAALVTVDGRLRQRTQRPTPVAPRGDAATVTGALLGIVDDVLGRAKDPVVAAGLACAGPLDLVAGTVSPVNIPAWRDEPIVDHVREVLPAATVVLLNDAVAAAVGEAWTGAGRGARTLLGSVVSTGVGGGLVIDGRPYVGPTGNAGHVGHVIVDVSGEPCACGSRGCVGDDRQRPAMVRHALQAGWEPDDGVDGQTLAQASRAGDPAAQAAFARGANALAMAFVLTSALLDLDRVVVGGGVAASGDVLFTPLRRAVADLAGMDFLRRMEIVPAALGPDAGLVGAARRAFDRCVIGWPRSSG